MTITAANHSSYPRIGDSADLQRLRRAVQDHQNGEIDDSGLAAIADSVTREVIDEQIAAGIDLVTDGQIRWNDPVSHPVRAYAGVEVNGLVRLYDTNFYFRQPVISQAPKRQGPSLADEYRTAKAHSKRPLKAALTGPFSISRLSKMTAGSLDDLTVALAAEVADLAAAGAPWIQIEEPEILRHPKEFRKAAEAISALAAKKGKARLIVTMHFADATPLFDKLQSLECDMLGFDLTYGPGLWKRLGGSDKPLMLGCIDARNTRMDDVAALAKRIRPVAKKTDVHLAPSAGLEYLPRDRAQRKLRLLAQLKEALS